MGSNGPLRNEFISYTISSLIIIIILLLIFYYINIINNIVALWRLGARNILELPLLAASSKMETVPMAGKT